MFGEVLDHNNGTYTARLRLPWAGLASVAIRLIHSSEAIQVLMQRRLTDSDRIYFLAYFVGKSPRSGRMVEEVVECNVKWAGVVLLAPGRERCEFHDAHTGLTWQCHKPATLPCDAWVYHSEGGFRKRISALEEILMDRYVCYCLTAGGCKLATDQTRWGLVVVYLLLQFLHITVNPVTFTTNNGVSCSTDCDKKHILHTHIMYILLDLISFLYLIDLLIMNLLICWSLRKTRATNQQK